MIAEADARQFAKDWVVAWNSHDLDAIMAHYGPDVILTSRVAARLLSDPSGTVTGREALRIYFQRGLEAYPKHRRANGGAFPCRTAVRSWFDSTIRMVRAP